MKKACIPRWRPYCIFFFTYADGPLCPGIHSAVGGTETVASLQSYCSAGSRLQCGIRGKDWQPNPQYYTQGTAPLTESYLRGPFIVCLFVCLSGT